MRDIKLGDVFFRESNGLFYQVDSIDNLGSKRALNCICGLVYDRESESVCEVVGRRWIHEDKTLVMHRENRR